MKHLLRIMSLVLFVVGSTYAQQTVSGTVKSGEDQSSLIGVSVLVKGTSQGTVTDTDGKYSISVEGPEAVLVFSYVGFTNQEVTVGNQSTIDVTLAPDDKLLEEVVVTALGIERDERSLGYSVQTVDGADLAETKEVNLVNSLQGAVAGVQIQGTTGNLGGSSRITVRGVNSFLGNNQPLFVVDGVPIDNSNYATNAQQTGFGGGSYDYGNAAQDINPNDIETMSVLKGSTASALYGNRGANGVILITTKSGKKKKKGLGISINSSLTFDNATRMIPHQREYGGGGINPNTATGFDEFTDTNGQNYLAPQYGKDGAWGPKYNSSLNVRHWDSFDPDASNYRETRPWIAPANDYTTFFETGQTWNNSIAFTGNNDKGSFRLAYTNLDQKGIMPNSGMQRNTVTLNSAYNLTEKLTVTGAGSFVVTEANGRTATGYDNRNPLQGFTQWWQTQLDFDRLQNFENVDGSQASWNRGAWNDGSPRYFDNPYFVRYRFLQEDRRDRFFGNIGATYEIVEGLTAAVKISTDSYSFQLREARPIGSVDVPEYREQTRTFRETNADFRLSYDKKIGDDISVNFILGANRMRQANTTITAQSTTGLNMPDFYNIANSAGTPDISTYTRNYGINSIYGLGSFGYKGMVFVDVTLRQDQSSTLPAGKNTYVYPSVTGSFVFSELPALANSNVLSFGKIRASYGTSANDAPVYTLTDTYEPIVPGLGSFPRAGLPNAKNNADLKPERTSEIEVGMDVRFLNGRVGVDVAYFDKTTTDQIFSVATSSITGYTSRTINAGSMRNSGIELMINATPVEIGDFAWDLSFNFARLRNEVVELTEGVNSINLGSTWAAELRINEGDPYMAIYGQDFVYDDNGKRVVDENGAYKFTDNRVFLGSAMADFTGGIRNTFRWKGLSASAMVDFQNGGAVHSTSLQWAHYSGMAPATAAMRDGQNVREVGMILDGVKEDGSVNDITIDPQSFYQSYWRRAALYFYDASFVKLREVRVGYTVPNSLLGNLPLKNVRIGFIGRNLAVLSANLPYLDPQMVTGSGNLQGLENAQTPATRSYGFNVGFDF